jgi:hypothetical protein
LLSGNGSKNLSQSQQQQLDDLIKETGYKRLALLL